MQRSHAPAGGNAPAKMLTVEEALTRLAEAATPVSGTEQRHLRDTLGRVLAETIRSPIDVPAYTNSAMDGYAVRAEDLPASGEAPLRLIGTSLAGHPFTGTVGAGETVRIMTGAALPVGADTVIMQEKSRAEGEQIFFGADHRAGANVRHAGEDIARDEVVFSPGKPIQPADIGVLASLGVAEVRVYRPLRVAFFSTGDELRSIGEPLQAGEIYDSNRYTLHGMLRRLGVDLIDMGVIRDVREEIAAAFHEAAEAADVVITSGGVSVGEADYVKETLEALGEIGFWKIAMKPGKPLAFGRLDRALFFGLPGNPVSAMATFYQIVRPTLLRMMGHSRVERIRFRVPCVEPLRKRPGRQEFQRGVLERDAEGNTVVRGLSGQGSHILTSMSHANCFIVLPAEQGDVEAGTPVEVEPFTGIL